LTFEEGSEALAAAAYSWPPDDPSDPSRDLAIAALSQPRDAYLEQIVEDFPRFSANARWHIVRMIAARGDELAAHTYLRIVDRYATGGTVPPAPLKGFEKSAACANLLLPRLMEHATADPFGYQIHLLALQAAKTGGVLRQVLAPFAGPVVEIYRPMRSRMSNHEARADAEWIWDKDYHSDRAHATLLLDLMGFLPGEAIIEALEDSLSSRDPRVLHFAVLSLLRLGQDIPASVIESVAASPEMHNRFHEGLVSLNRGGLFPRRLLTQEAFAESDMVGWLTYPTELGRTPNEIELMATFENQGGDQQFFLFRFRTHSPHWAAKKGWMAGLSGPFETAVMPTSRAGGSTFSTFTKWEEKTPQEHFIAISGLIAEHWKRRAAE